MRLGFGNWLIEKLGSVLMKDKRPIHGFLCDFDRIRYEVRPGDVLLVEGRNRVSHIIQQITQSPWSHAMLYIGRIHDIDDPTLRQFVKKHYDGPAGEQLIIESMLGKGTIVAPLLNYKDDHIRICRPQGLARTDAQKIIRFAIGRLGGQYDLRHIFDLLRFLFPWTILPRRWRSSLFNQNALKPTHDICSSMIAEAFSSVKFPILPIIKHDTKDGIQLIVRHHKLFTPSDFDYSPYFNIIKYPFFAISGGSTYQDLPWREDVIAIDDRHKIEVIEKIRAEMKAANEPIQKED